MVALPGHPGQREHLPAGAHDFPALDSQQLVCRACSYADGIPVAPIGWPCPVLVEDQEAEQAARRRRRGPAIVLAGKVTARRVQLGLTRAQLAQQAGISLSTIRHVENGRSPHVTADTLTGLDRGLRWYPGSARRVLDGGEPYPLSADTEIPADQQVVLRAGLPVATEAYVVDHLRARRQDMEAALEQEARMLVALLSRGVGLSADGEVDGDA